MQTSIITLQNELEKARERLKGVEESIKKNIGRDITSLPPSAGFRTGFKRGARHLDEDGGEEGREREGRKVFALGPRNSDSNWGKEDLRNRMSRRVSNFNNIRNRLDDKKPEERTPAKRRLGEQQAITVFSRLSGPPKDEEFEEDHTVKVSSQVIVQEAPSRREVLAAQSGDNQCKERNKRMFGALLGTLQKFRQEENLLKEKEEKRAQVERKLEEAAEREKEEAKRTRQELFTSRRNQQMEIRQLEYKLLRIKRLKEWEESKVHFKNFIQTKTSPKIFYLPKVHNEKSLQLLEETRDTIQKMIDDKRAEVNRAISDHVPETKNTHEKESKILIRGEDMEEDDDEESKGLRSPVEDSALAAMKKDAETKEENEAMDESVVVEAPLEPETEILEVEDQQGLADEKEMKEEDVSMSSAPDGETLDKELREDEKELFETSEAQ